MTDKNLSWKQKIIDPKNPKIVGKNWSNLGNHILIKVSKLGVSK